jgi:glycosyltransferase involved in cell wall biosynthesis
MIKIAHILDDICPGGVTRLLGSLIGSLTEGMEHRQYIVSTRFSLPDKLDADVIVVHFTTSWAKMPFLLELRLRHWTKKLIVVEHSYTGAYEQLCVPSQPRFRCLLKYTYLLADHVVAVSKGQARWIVSAGLADVTKVTVASSVLDLSSFEALAPPVITPGPMRLGAFGRFHKQKGFDTLLQAMERVPADIATLDLAGSGEEEAGLQSAANRLAHVRLRDWVNPVSFVDEMDVIVLPSRWEAGAVSCWEVRAAARPVIVTAVDGLPEQVPPEIGIVVPAEDAVALADAIIAMASANRAAMSSCARRSTVGAYAATLASWRSILLSPRASQRSHFTSRAMAAAVGDPKRLIDLRSVTALK